MNKPTPCKIDVTGANTLTRNEVERVCQANGLRLNDRAKSHKFRFLCVNLNNQGIVGANNTMRNTSVHIHLYSAQEFIEKYEKKAAEAPQNLTATEVRSRKDATHFKNMYGATAPKLYKYKLVVHYKMSGKVRAHLGYASLDIAESVRDKLWALGNIKRIEITKYLDAGAMKVEPTPKKVETQYKERPLSDRELAYKHKVMTAKLAKIVTERNTKELPALRNIDEHIPSHQLGMGANYLLK